MHTVGFIKVYILFKQSKNKTMNSVLSKQKKLHTGFSYNCVFYKSLLWTIGNGISFSLFTQYRTYIALKSKIELSFHFKYQ